MLASRPLRAACLAGTAILVLATSGCASGSRPKGDGAVGRAVTRTQSGVGDAALTPLNDLNLRRVPIPPRLEAINSPYEPIKRRDCIGLGAEVSELTAILGPDADAPEEPDDTLSQKTGDEAAHLALNEVKDAVTGFIPYRSLVRMASGASEHERRLRAAYERGVQRRAYLKGVGLAMGCAPPAAPDPRGATAPEGPPIVYRGADPSPG